MKSPEQKPKLNNEKSIPHSLDKADKIFDDLEKAHWENKKMIDREMLTQYPEVLDKRLKEMDEEISFATGFASTEKKAEEATNIMKEIKENQAKYLKAWNEEKDMNQAKGLKKEINQLLSKINRRVLIITPEEMKKHIDRIVKKLKIDADYEIDGGLGIRWGYGTGMASIVKVLSEPNNQVRVINLQFFHMGDEGAKMFAGALMDPNSRVRILYLLYNKIGGDGAKAIAEALTHPNNKVRFINLSQNNTGNQGAKAIVGSLAHPNNQVNWISLGDNNITDNVKLELHETVRQINQTTGREIKLFLDS